MLLRLFSGVVMVISDFEHFLDYIVFSHFFMVSKINRSDGYDYRGDDQTESGNEVKDEENVVIPADAVINPTAVVVKVQNALIADIAVLAFG